MQQWVIKIYLIYPPRVVVEILEPWISARTIGAARTLYSPIISARITFDFYRRARNSPGAGLTPNSQYRSPSRYILHPIARPVLSARLAGSKKESGDERPQLRGFGACPQLFFFPPFYRSIIAWTSTTKPTYTKPHISGAWLENSQILFPIEIIFSKISI